MPGMGTKTIKRTFYPKSQYHGGNGHICPSFHSDAFNSKTKEADRLWEGRGGGKPRSGFLEER